MTQISQLEEKYTYMNIVITNGKIVAWEKGDRLVSHCHKDF
jgi:hypothetical protein